MSDDLDYAALSTRVEKAVKTQKRAAQIVFFAVSLLLLAVMGVIALGLSFTIGGMEAALIVLGLGWLLTIMMQFFSMLFGLGVFDNSLRRQILARELGVRMLEHHLTRLANGAHEKPKRESAERLAISDDGELIRYDDQEPGRRASS
jgi:hypothetical protein